MRLSNHVLKTIPAICIAAMMISASIAAQSATAAKADSSKTASTPAEHPKLKPQTTCPVQGGPIHKKLFADYKGKRIYVCCPDCIDSVKANPQKYIDKLKSLGQSVETIAPAKKSSAKDAETGYWTCPMHPEIHQASSGACPICGMSLVFKKTEKDSTQMKEMDHSKMKM
jgi:YHS domain-containing protein